VEQFLGSSLKLRCIDKSVRIFIDFALESIEVELVPYERFVDLTEEVVILQSAKPLDPAYVGVLAELGFFTHQSLIIMRIDI
jgi:hypothetical protein